MEHVSLLDFTPIPTGCNPLPQWKVSRGIFSSFLIDGSKITALQMPFVIFLTPGENISGTLWDDKSYFVWLASTLFHYQKSSEDHIRCRKAAHLNHVAKGLWIGIPTAWVGACNLRYSSSRLLLPESH